MNIETENWVENFAVVFIVLGFLLSILIRSPSLNYLAIILSGALAGRQFYVKKYQEPILPFLIITFFFLLGFLLASFWSSRLLVLLFFFLAAYLSYTLHVKKIITIFKSENFFK